MRIGSLFSGAGGLDMAVEAAFGGEVIWHCEVDPAASKVLAHRWPDVSNLGDITEVDWDLVSKGMPIEVLCGGFPCQDVSAAGRRAGIREGTRSGLWARFADAIEALRPPIVVIENVRGLLSADGEPWPDEVQLAHDKAERLKSALAAMNSHDMWKRSKYGRRRHAWLVRSRDRAVARFGTLRKRLVQRAIGTVVSDLADLGYDAQWATIAAASVGAPHQRERVFIIATSADTAGDRRHAWQSEPTGLERRPDAAERGDGSIELLPTPRSLDATGVRGRTENRSEEANARAGLTLTDVTEHLLPTPTTLDHVEKRTLHAGGNLTLQGALGGVNPVDAQRLLPTPVCTDAKGARNSTASRQPGSTANIGDTLSDVIYRGDLLPTPQAQDGNGGGRCNSEGHQETLPGTVRLLPTPSVADADGGHASRSGDRSNELLLPGIARAVASGGLLPTPLARDSRQTSPGDYARHTPSLAAVDHYLPTPSASEGTGGGQHPDAPGRQGHSRQLIDYALMADSPQWGKYEPAIRRWESVTRPAPAPTEPNRNGNQRLAASFSEWMMGWPAGWVTDVDGISRNDALRIIGNGVCPQQAYAAIRLLLSVCEVAA